jgi:hypothetical protein
VGGPMIVFLCVISLAWMSVLSRPRLDRCAIIVLPRRAGATHDHAVRCAMVVGPVRMKLLLLFCDPVMPRLILDRVLGLENRAHSQLLGMLSGVSSTVI